MTKSIQLAALVLAAAFVVVACKPADSSTTTTETKATTSTTAVPAVPGSEPAKQ